jgi:hypothetical protein
VSRVPDLKCYGNEADIESAIRAEELADRGPPMKLDVAALAGVRLIVWWPASSRARPRRDGYSVRRRMVRARLARAAGMLTLGGRQVDMVVTGRRI